MQLMFPDGDWKWTSDSATVKRCEQHAEILSVIRSL